MSHNVAKEIKLLKNDTISFIAWLKKLRLEKILIISN
jgi:hypothetical protein